MNISNRNDKSPIKAMFSSVFKREDIKLSRSPLSTLNKSDANILYKSRDTTPLKIVSRQLEAVDSSRYLTPEHIPQKLNKSTFEIQKASDKNTQSTYTYTKVDNLKDLRYEELLKKYDRMQEFYKSQVSSLTQEVEHYKSLYQKLVNYKGIDSFK